MKPGEQRQDRWRSFLVDCTLEDVSRLLMSPPVTLRPTTGPTGEMCSRVSVHVWVSMEKDARVGAELSM